MVIVFSYITKLYKLQFFYRYMIDSKHRYFRPIALAFIMAVFLVFAVRGWAFQGEPKAASEASSPSSAPVSKIRTSSGELNADFDEGRPQAGDTDKIVEAIVNRQPLNERLFLIGPGPTVEKAPKSGDPAKRRHANDGAHPSDRDTSAAAETEAAETVLEDNWVQMNLDEDGTYLFVGEGAQGDEALTDNEMLDLDDIGVGIGKKWHF